MTETASGQVRELFGAGQLAQHARDLAERHTLVSLRKPLRRRTGHGLLLARLAETERVLYEVRTLLLDADRQGIDVTPAGAWLLDAFFVVIEHGREVRASMPQGYYHQLPKIESGPYRGYPRIYCIAIELIAHTEGQLDEQNMKLMLREYQSVAPLTLGELWAWPVMLRMGLLESVRRMALRTKRDVIDAGRADAQVQRFRDASGDEVRLRAELAEFVAHPPEMPAAFLTRFFQQMRVARADLTALLWLEQWIAEDEMSVEAAVQHSARRLSLTQLVMANSITSLRKVASFAWPDFVESLSETEKVLRDDPAGFYAAMTFDARDLYRHAVEELAKHSKSSEPSVARAAIALAVHAMATLDDKSATASDNRDRIAHVGYYLVGCGRATLERVVDYRPAFAQRIARLWRRHPGRLYFGSLVLTVLAMLAVVTLPLPRGTPWGMRVFSLFLALLPASELGIAIVNQLITIFAAPDRLSRLDYPKAGVPEEHRTLVVIPLLLDSVASARDAFDHLETQFLANRDPSIRFAVLSDFTDADSETRPNDDAIVEAAVESARALNREYAENRPFVFLQRPRRYNAQEGAWMGWERKRGKLMELNAYLNRGVRDAFSTIVGDSEWLDCVRYVITLDADTLLPRGAAAELIGTIAHPLNRAVFSEGGSRVVDGYGILQPRVTVTLESANQSRFAAIFAGQPGVDPYTTAVSDVYQDLFGEGSYTGKGIYDVAAFERATLGRFPENALLSHDLIEGAYARAGLVTDVEIFDEYPSRYLTSVQRQQRWLRGDWQLLPFIFGSGSSGDGLSALSRWKMFDNMRRSLVPVMMLAWLVAGWAILPGSPAVWTAVALGTFVMRWLLAPAVAAARPPRGQSWRGYYAELRRDAEISLEQAALAVVLLQHETLITIDAIVRALVRTFVTHRRMLEWTTSSQVEHLADKRKPSLWRQQLLAGAAGLVLATWGAISSHLLLVLPLVICWAVAPFVADRISRPSPRRDLELTPAQRTTLLGYGARHWSFFDRFVSETTQWLAPDNYQETPKPVVADRTSPTNLGLQLMSTVSAFDLGFITQLDMIERLERAFATMDSMGRLRGHFYNWYRLSDLGVLEPPYISTVDSGNLAGHLLAIAAACREIAEREPGQVSEAAETARLESIGSRARTMALEMDFTLLFDDKARLFSIGFDERANRLDPSSYDLLASEARLASFIAIAKGDAPTEHWFRLGRALTSKGGATALVSWSGSMFEYLMPLLVMPSPPYSLLDQTHRAAVRRQITYARARSVPWGISESAYNIRDRHDTYQYRAFGVPDLALKRGLANDLVVAPYATVLALAVDPREALSNLAVLEREGALGEFGFLDAIDYSRPDERSSRAVVRTSMAHHIGMSLVALDNALNNRDGVGLWQRRFMSDPLTRAARILLHERVPRRYSAQEPQPDVPEKTITHMTPDEVVVREYDTAQTAEPRVCLLGDYPYCVLITNAGSGYSRSNGMAVTRWRADATRDDTGQWIYVKDVSTRRVWSAAHQPTRAAPDHYRVTFATDRAVFQRRDRDIETRMDIIVVPRDRAEVRVVAVTNKSRVVREIELTSYGEVVLTDPDADRAHAAFQNLFVETEWSPDGIILASRRPRSANEKRVWCAHVVATGPECEGKISFDTDRAQFVGRGRTVRAPRALDHGVALSGSVGAVLDPIVSLRVRLRLEAGRTARVAFTTLVADSRDEARNVADRYRDLRGTDRALSLSWTTAKVELRDLDVRPAEAALYQVLAGALIYPNDELRASATMRSENRRGQRSLWALGISGDWPLVIATIDSETGLSSVRQLLSTHKYWRMKGVTADLIIVNKNEPSYIQDLNDQIVSIIRSSSEGGFIDRPGGVFVRRADTMTPEDLSLLHATARVTIICDGVGLGKIIDGITLEPPSAVEEWNSTERLGRETHREMRAASSANAVAPASVPNGKSQEAISSYANGIGRLTERGDYEMLIAGGRVPPAPWSNIIANPNAGFCVTERGGGFSWVENSYFYRLTPWHNDPVSDPCGEVLYLRDDDSGSVWTPTPGPAPAIDAAVASGEPSPSYVVQHAPGRTTFTHERDSISTSLELGVPQSDPVKISRLTITNRGDTTRRITLTSYVELTLGAQREHTRHQLHTWRDEQTGGIFAENYFMDDFASRVAFSWVTGPVTAFTANRDEFLGRNGDLTAPEALTSETLSGSTGAGYDPCAALRSVLTLEPGASREIVILLGAARSQGEARAIIARHATPASASAAVADAVRAWDERLTIISARTPSPEFNAMVNRWPLYQALACRMWARSAFYQSSGAYGFRDQLQDCMAFVYAEPAIAREHIMRCAGRQFVEGDVQHWWHEPGGRGVRTRFSDDLAWLPYVADHYVVVTGDALVWDERAPFLEQRTLAPDEQETYDEPRVSAESATLYEHCVRALDRASTVGQHGLPLMGGGDWNDGMNRVGAEGKGESVWLAWFLISTLRKFAEHAARRSDGAVAERCRQRATDYAAAIERTSWDGDWYRRAYFDDGTPLGSAQSAECQIDAIAQSWSVLSGAGDPTRAHHAMESAVDRLVNEDARLIMLLTPPFDQTERDPGYIKGYLPGVRENGAQYTHAALWTALAMARMGDGDRAQRLFEMLNPHTHSATAEDVDRYKVEPYVVCADVYTSPHHVGRGGWTWYTGSASWMYRVALEEILGFTKHGDSLTIDPCVPLAWREFAMDYRHGSATYAIAVRNPDGVARGVVRVEVDGSVAYDRAVKLVDDGASHDVVVIMGHVAENPPSR